LEGFPDLKTGHTLDFFHSFGKQPDSSEALKIIIRGSTRTYRQSLTKKPGSPSGPDVILFGILFMALIISVSEILSILTVGKQLEAASTLL
jgi:hypothetical protein